MEICSLLENVLLSNLLRIFIDKCTYSLTPYANIRSANITVALWKYTVAGDA